MYVVEEGQVHIKLNTLNNGPLTLAELEEGEFFGELALLDESPRSADAASHNRQCLYRIFPSGLIYVAGS